MIPLLLCWINAALQLLMLTPFEKFLCGKAIIIIIRYTKRTFDFNSNRVDEYCTCTNIGTQEVSSETIAVSLFQDINLYTLFIKITFCIIIQKVIIDMM